MQYRKLVKGSDELSVLGYGCMRFPSKNGRVDEVKVEEQILYSINQGVNYFDTAYPYHNGKSEVILGKVIRKHNLRNHVFIADKLPAFLVKKPEQIETFFKTQLERLEMTYIDYYLMHMLGSLKSWQQLKDFGVIEFLEEKKAAGQIRHIGFSFHGMPDEFIKILEDYNWDFCQIQFNYLDEFSQAGLTGLKRAHELDIGVVIMEPLRGGNLAAKAPNKVKDRFNDFSLTRSPADWALRWIWNHEEISVILSGMNVDEHIIENIRVASEVTPNSMSKEEIQVVNDVKIIYRDLMKVPCTGCNYCMPCPFGVDIPQTFTDYNNKYFFGSMGARAFYIGRDLGMVGKANSGANHCSECGLCEKHCPQNIAIRQELKNAHRELNNQFMRLGMNVVSKVSGMRRD